MNAYEFLNEYYSSYDEDGRLRSKHGMIEFITTVNYVEKYLKPGMKILEVGAGTGRYSHYFAGKGYSVDAVELIPANIEKFKANTAPDEDVRIYEGNAVKLDFLPDGEYDIVLLLGPMYHLFTVEDQFAAYSEAMRVAKVGGVVFTSYCMNDATVISYCFGKNQLKRCLDAGLIDDVKFKCLSSPEELFVLMRREEIFDLTSPFVDSGKAERLHFVGTDMYTNYYRDMVDSLDEENYGYYVKYHLSICEREDMVGISHHTLDVTRKIK